MKNKIKKLSLTRKFFISMILSVTFLMILLICLEIYHSFNKYQLEVELLQVRSMGDQKDLIRNEVDKVIFYISELIIFSQQLPPESQMDLPELKQFLISEIIDFRYRSDGYFFGSTRDGEPLFSNGIITQGTGSVWDLTDPDGVKIIQKQQEAFDNPNGVFTEYSWRKLNQSEPSPKISYTKAIPELDWIIGTGVYLVDINQQISYQKKQLRSLLQNRTISYLTLLFAYFLLSFLIIKHFSSNIKSNIESFSHFFFKASDNYDNIDLDSLHYSEFREIATAANIMIDKRKKSDDALKLSENKYKQLIETTSEGFWMINPEMITLEVNESVCQMLGYSPDQIIGKSPIDFIDENDQHIFLTQFNQSPDLIHNSYEMHFTSKSGNKIPCHIKATNLYYQNNEFYAAFAFITDITDRKKYEQKLKDYHDHLEDLIKIRTKDLEEKNEELKKYNKLFIGREFRIKELRDQVKAMEEKLDSLSPNNS